MNEVKQSSELELMLSGDSAAAPPAFILETLPADTACRRIDNAPHTIFEELWHITFWQQVTLDWISGTETPFPAHPSDGFPRDNDPETWDDLCRRFFRGNEQAAIAARATEKLDQPVRCPSRPGIPTRIMTIREQLESLGAHNHYHLGRIVLLRQLLGCWPPPSGGFSW